MHSCTPPLEELLDIFDELEEKENRSELEEKQKSAIQSQIFSIRGEGSQEKEDG